MTLRRTATTVAAVCLLVAAAAAVGGQAIPAAAQSDGIQASTTTAAVGEQITFQAPAIGAESYEWRFGDDAHEIPLSGETVTHEYLDPGTYTVAVDAGTTTYTTTVTVEPAFANVTHVESGTELWFDGGSRSVAVDVYAVEVPGGHHFGVSAAAGVGSDGLRLYDASGDLLVSADLSPDTTLVGTSLVGTTAPEGGATYYVAIQRGDGFRYLSFEESIPPDEFEPNQQRATATPFDAGKTVSGVLGGDDMVDWFAVDSGAGSLEATVELNRLARNQPNVAVELYDASGTRIGELGPDTVDGNQTAANGATLDFTAVQRADVPTDGVYYVRVSAVPDDRVSVRGPDVTPRPYELTVDAPATGPSTVVPGGAAPTDPDGDGLYEDVNGDGVVNMVDVQALFANEDSAAVRDNQAAFDFNGDGTISVVDVQALYVESNES